MMKVIHTQRIANDKVALLMNGYSAFAETEEVIRLVNRRIHRNNLNIIVERIQRRLLVYPGTSEQSPVVQSGYYSRDKDMCNSYLNR